jgi:ferredoxin
LPKIRVEPLAIEFEAERSVSVMTNAERLGYRWPTVCHGRGQCTACVLRVLANAEHLSEISTLEREALARLTVQAGEVLRLACQACAVGDVTVFKRGVRRVEP